MLRSIPGSGHHVGCYQMKMIGHRNECDKLALGFIAQSLAFFKKGVANGLLLEDGKAISDSAGYKMQCSGEIAVGPFARHGEVVILSRGAC